MDKDLRNFYITWIFILINFICIVLTAMTDKDVSKSMIHMAAIVVLCRSL
jgi:hypothetical protein